MHPLQSAILKTLAYADIFDQALTTEELLQNLIGYKIKKDDEVATVKGVRILHEGNLFALPGREPLLTLKHHQLGATAAKLAIARRNLWAFRLLPWVKLVAVTGSVGGGTPKPDDDIDLLIITQPHRLWLTRLLLTSLLSLMGKRRKPNDDPNRVNNKLCLNMWLSLDDLVEKNQDIYTAIELAHVLPILNRQHTYEHYLQANSWMFKLLPNFAINIQGLALPQIARKSYSAFDTLDHWTEWLQRKIMKKPTIEIIEQDRLAFHPHDYRTEVLQKYKHRLKQLGF